MKLRVICFFIVLSAALTNVFGVTVEQVISHENAAFNLMHARSTMVVGFDGLVYIGNSFEYTGYVIRLKRDGSEKFGGQIHYAMTGIGANANSIFAVSSAHFSRRITLFDANLREYGFQAPFLVSDNVGWNAPANMCVGESGDFYGIDQHTNKIFRISPLNKIVAEYPIIAEGEDPLNNAGMYQIQVSESTETFYHRNSGGSIRAIGFDGRTKFIHYARLAGGDSVLNGGFWVTPEGLLYTIGADSNTVVGVDQNGNVFGSAELMSDGIDTDKVINNLAVSDGDIFIKRQNPIYLFERYGLDGQFKNRIAIDHEKLAVTFDDEKWIAGGTIDFQVDFQALEGRLGTPDWHLWMRPYDSSKYIEIPMIDGQITVPDNLSPGLYFWKVSPEIQPVQYGTKSQYLVYGVVEILPANNTGTINVATTQNRVNYGRGETIKGGIFVQSDVVPQSVVLELRDSSGQSIAKTPAMVFLNNSKQLDFVIESNLTDYLSIGEYTLVAVSNGYTSVPQNIIIGSGTRDEDRMFNRIVYGDYGEVYVRNGTWWNSSDLVEGRNKYYARLNVNLLVDRLGSPPQHANLRIGGGDRTKMDELKNRLTVEGIGVSPVKAELASSALQTMAGYSKNGMGEIIILTMMDAGLPLGGPGFDNRTPERFFADMEYIQGLMENYGAMRGWAWSGNWWIYDEYKEHPEWRTAYPEARKKAWEEGVWDPVLDEAYYFWASQAYIAQEMLNNKLNELDPQDRYVTASAGSVRNVRSYPPLSLANVKEIDLFAQWEQMGPPFNGMFNVDYYSRPGKPSFAHPEIWNDSGTGDQILPTYFAHMMRGVDGMGQSGIGPNWGPVAEDNRGSSQGIPSIHRVVNNTAKEYGPWMTTLENNDKVALVVSQRMCAIDDYYRHASMGRYFAQLLEAYASLMHAHHPATIVYTEDLQTANSLGEYKAIIIVGQVVDFEPRLKIALNNAKQQGSTVLYDKSCRAEFLKDFTPLDVAFNKYGETVPVGNDYAYWDCLRVVLENVPELRKTLDNIVPPAVDIDNPEVFATEFVSGDGRYIMLVNNSTPLFEPGNLWRTGLVITSRLPVIEELTLNGGAIYDVFAMKQVTPVNGKVTADLRSLPSRIFAVLPSAISSVSLYGPPANINSGSSVRIDVAVMNAENRTINANIPVKITLQDSSGYVIEEFYASAGLNGLQTTINIPYNISGSLTLSATELFSGISSELSFNTITTTALGLNPNIKPTVQPTEAGKLAVSSTVAQEDYYGVHAKDVIITNNGNDAVINIMNWDSNLISVNTATGELNWAKRVGHHFTFAPEQLNGNEIAVQGFDMDTAEGYHLYLGDSSGNFTKRFALYGLSRRHPQRFIPYLVNNTMNKFAIAPDVSWVAASGDLGIAVWDKVDGKLLYDRKDWEHNRNYNRALGVNNWDAMRLDVPYLIALDNDTVVIADGVKLTAINVRNSNELWSLELSSNGDVKKAMVANNGNMTILTTSSGGRVFVVSRDGKIVDTIPTLGDNFDLSENGEKIVVVQDNVLKYYELKKGLIWSFSGDSQLRMPKISLSNDRVTVNSEIGTLYVVSADGKILLEKDMGAHSVSSWLSNDRLFVTTWMGKVSLLDESFNVIYEKHLDVNAPQLTPTNVLYKDNTPTVRIEEWSDASEVVPEGDNLLSMVTTRINFVDGGRNNGRFMIEFDPNPEDGNNTEERARKLCDGDFSPPKTPYLHWKDISWFGEGAPLNWLEFEMFNTAVKLTGVAFYEDPEHPESWLRDVHIEVWNSEIGVWEFVQKMLSDSSVHYHELNSPVVGRKFRIISPPGLVGNIRLGEIVFFGEVIGPAHPDVLAKKDVATLFDEAMDNFSFSFSYNNNAKFDYTDAVSGVTSFAVGPNADVGALWYWPWGHLIPEWNFDVVEYPEPGQYRYFEIWVKADSDDTKSISIRLPSFGDLTYYMGSLPTHPMYGKVVQVSEEIPLEWTPVRIDLFDAIRQNGTIKDIRFHTIGGGVKFDKILLHRTTDSIFTDDAE